MRVTLSSVRSWSIWWQASSTQTRLIRTPTSSYWQTSTALVSGCAIDSSSRAPWSSIHSIFSIHTRTRRSTTGALFYLIFSLRTFTSTLQSHLRVSDTNQLNSSSIGLPFLIFYTNIVLFPRAIILIIAFFEFTLNQSKL